MKNYKEDGIRMGNMTFTRKNYEEAEQEVKKILGE